MKMRWIIGSILVVFLALVIGLVSYFEKTNELLSGSYDMEKETASLEVVSFISPHHLTAKDLIMDIFREVSEENKNVPVESIVLISPDHQNVGHGWVAVSGESRNIDGGVIEPDIKLVDFLASEKIAYRQDSVFHGEHGIENLLPYVKKYFPSARVTALMIRDGYPEEKARTLGDELAKFNSGKTLLILSADFSHYIGATAARMHDKKSIETIASSDYESVARSDVDCRGGIDVLLDFSQKNGYDKFNLVKNSNSSEIYKTDLGSENTSYVTGFFSSGEKIDHKKTVDILFADGDEIQNSQNIERLFWSQDENIFDFKNRYDKKIIQGKEFVFISSDKFGDDPEILLEKIKGLKTEDNLVIAYYEHKPGKSVLDDNKNQSDAHSLIDAGADLVIGSGSATTGQMEIYRNKAIFYSLGKFSAENSKIMVLGSSFDENNITFYLIPLQKTKNGEIMIMSGKERNDFLTEKSGSYLFDKQVKDDILDGELSLYLK